MATIQKRGNNYRIRVSAGYDMTGKQIMKSTTYTPAPGMTPKQIDKEVERQAVLFEERVRTGQVLDGTVRFAEFADKWFTDYADKQLRPTTLARYKDMMPRINAAIGHMQLEKIQPQHLMTFYKNLAESGIRADEKYHCTVDLKALLKKSHIKKVELAEKAGVSLTTLSGINQGRNVSRESAAQISKALDKKINDLFSAVGTDKTLSSKTVLHHHRLISSILSTAVHWQVIFANPCDRVKPPKVERKEAKYLDEEQATHLLQLLEKENIQYRTIVKLLLYTGLRRGELCGLTWDDINFDDRLLSVNRSSLYLAEKGIFEDLTKNYTSQRVIKLSDAAADMMKEFKIWQTQQRLLMGDRWTFSNRIFTAENGGAINPDVITDWFHKFIKKSDLPDISIHSLRHTNATLQIAGGVPITTVAGRLGHANETTTGKIYAHAIKSANEAAADTLQDILNPG
jgi:integrase